MDAQRSRSQLLGAADDAESPGERRDALEIAVLGAALVLGLLRFVRLGRWSLWYDEVLTWGDAHSSLKGMLNDLGYLMIRWTVEALGGEPTEVHLRLLPAVVGFACVPLAYWAFRPLAGGRRAALCALIVAVSAWQLQWAQTARFYTFCQAAGLVGAGVALRGALAGSWWRTLIGIGIAGGGVLFHLQGAIVAGALALALAVVPPATTANVRRASRAAFVVVAVAGAVAAPLVFGAWRDYVDMKAVDGAVSGVAHFALTTGWYVTPALGAFALAGAIGVIAGRDRRGGLALVVPLIGVLALTIAASQATTSAQYAFALFPWIALVAAWPIGAKAVAETRLAPLALVVVLALPQLAESALYLTERNGQRPRWREAVEYVAARREPGELVASFPAAVTEFYLTGARGIEVRRAESVLNLDHFVPHAYEEWVRDGRPMWFVLRADYLNTCRPADLERLRRFLSEECRMMKTFDVRVDARDLSIEVWHYE